MPLNLLKSGVIVIRPEYAMNKKSVRGGSWYDRPKHASATTRWGYYTWQKVYNVGFRVVMEE
jgi:formylglycine-generating enzyme required for sulfatase activity